MEARFSANSALPKPGLVLASVSPRRRELLALLGCSFEVMESNADEAPLEDESPAAMVLRLAYLKAQSVAAKNPQAVVLGCDTTVAFEGTVLGKPASAHEARAMLLSLRGRMHVVYSGIAIVGQGRTSGRLVETKVVMREYPEEELDRYVESGDPLDKAGGYAIQHADFRPVDSWDGCYANVMGLPLCYLIGPLRQWGIVPFADVPRACQSFTGESCQVWNTLDARELPVRHSRL